MYYLLYLFAITYSKHSFSFTDKTMSAKIILTSEPGSAKFSDRVLLLGQEAGMVSRSSREKKSDTYNAVFECLVRHI